mmetsp:Transcript_69365/g.185032  ORF Transcript_69365/g.185032 Transcript_69365/m.185032 type:complete len:126 (+) Transcript_69365:3-380(+)
MTSVVPVELDPLSSLALKDGGWSDIEACSPEKKGGNGESSKQSKQSMLSLQMLWDNLSRNITRQHDGRSNLPNSWGKRWETSWSHRGGFQPLRHPRQGLIKQRGSLRIHRRHREQGRRAITLPRR